MMVQGSNIPFVRNVSGRTSDAFRYLLSYKSLVEDLNTQIENFKNVKERVRKVYKAMEEMTENHVLEWKKRVKRFNARADELLSRDKSSWTMHFRNPVSRIRQGREAAHLAKYVAELTVSGEELLGSEVAIYVPTEHDSTYLMFGSRQEDYVKLRESLVREDGDPIVGLCGRPGVGKTRMVEQFCSEAREKGIFDKIVRAHAGRVVNVMNIQDQLAGDLNCIFVPKSNELDRASQLYKSLNERAKILVVLDDVWDVIDLKKIGIPVFDGSPKGYTILLTSHSRDVCLANKCKDPIEIKKLTRDESWEMFKNTVGTLKNDSLHGGLAEEVFKRCAGLPLLIRTVGRALQSVPENLWKDTLNEIEDGRFGWIDGIEPQVYACLKMSFEKLKDESKTCLLLCSLFPDNADIEIKMLSDLAIGSQMLDTKINIRVYIDFLKASCLLIQGKDEYAIRMPDIMREVARSVAKRDPKYAFAYIRCKSYLPDNVDYSTRRLLHLDLQGNYVGFPYVLVCPNLSILWLQCNNHNQLLSGGLFTNLRLLVIKGMAFAEENFSSNPMEKLQILILYGCYLNKTFLGFLNDTAHNIETLSIRECDLPEHNYIRPPNVFTNLHIIDISRCTGSKFLFPVAIVNCLVHIQDLRVEGCHAPEEIVRKDDSTDDKAIICFPKLKSLMLDDLPRLAQFYSDKPKGISSSVETMDKTGRSSISFFSEKVTFSSLEKLIIKKIGNATEIWGYKATGLQRFKNLKEVIISECQSLNNVFHHSFARDCAKLETMHVTSCELMSAIVEQDEEEDGLKFPALTELYLGDLSNLILYCHQSGGTYPHQHQGSIPKVTFPNMVRFKIWGLNTSLTDIKLGRDDSSSDLMSMSSKYFDEVELPSQWQLKLQNLEALQLTNCWWPGPLLFPGSLTFKRLKVLKVDHCGVSTFFTSSVFRSFQNLEELTISDCDLLENIVENEEPAISLPQLQVVIFRRLPNLKKSGISSCNMPSLKVVQVDYCGLLTLFTSYAFRNLKQLQKLDVSNCPSLEEIVENEVDGETTRTREKLSLLLLKELSIHSLPRLKSFSQITSYAFNMPELESVSLYDCPSMKTFTNSQIEVPSVEIINRDHVRKTSDLNSYVEQHVYVKIDKSSTDVYTGDAESNSKVKDDNSLKDGAGDGESSVGKTLRRTRRLRALTM